jgi:hypothetical protein
MTVAVAPDAEMQDAAGLLYIQGRYEICFGFHRMMAMVTSRPSTTATAAIIMMSCIFC